MCVLDNEMLTIEFKQCVYLEIGCKPKLQL